MTRLENRLGEACREAADTVRAETIRSLDLDPSQPAKPGSARRTRRPGRVLGPLAAAASVAVIAIGASIVVPRLLGSAPDHHPGKARHNKPAVAAKFAALPTYTVVNNSTQLDVVATATGRVVGRLPVPAHQTFETVVGTVGDRTFFAAADEQQGSCQATFYQFSLNSSGQPSALTPLLPRTLPGLSTAVAANATGSLVGYSVVECAGQSGLVHPVGTDYVIGHIGVIDVAARKITRQWSYTIREDYTNDLTMSADGSLLGYSNYLGNNPVGRLLPTSAPSGPDERHGRIVVRRATYTALSPDGQLMYALTGTSEQVLAAYDAANGRQVKALDQWPVRTDVARAVIDPAGGYALVPFTKYPAHPKLNLYPFRRGHPCNLTSLHHKLECARISVPVTHFMSINLTTGAVTILPFHEVGPPGWGTVAW